MMPRNSEARNQREMARPAARGYDHSPMPDVFLHQLPHSPFCLAIAQALTGWNVRFVPVNVSNGN